MFEELHALDRAETVSNDGDLDMSDAKAVVSRLLKHTDAVGLSDEVLITLHFLKYFQNYQMVLRITYWMAQPTVK